MANKSKTKAEKAHLSRVAGLGCIVCKNNGFDDTPSEIHHLRNGQGGAQRASHYETIPLCTIHHRHSGHGEIAFHASQYEFEERYGTERELLDQVKGLLGEE